jgi:kumamolisin
MTQVNETLKEAALLGVSVCVASGDDGSCAAIQDGHAHVVFPASSPYVLAVGGTTIVSGKDIAWKDGNGVRPDGGSTGGGVSVVFDRPAWQSKVGVASINPAAKAGRCLPDVAANADWDASPYLLVVDGQAQPNGGTSAATPLWASLITLINAQRGPKKRVGYLTPVLYQATSGPGGQTIGAASCVDIKSGNNTTDPLGGYSASVGYDVVSGWGPPNGQTLMAALAKI